MNVTHPLHNSHVAIGNELNPAAILLTLYSFLLTPIIIILHNHQAVAATQLVLAVEDGVADALIVDVGTLVAAGDDDGVINASMTIAGGQRLYQLVARNNPYVVKVAETNLRHKYSLSSLLFPLSSKFSPLSSNSRRIKQDARLLRLAQHLVQVGLKNGHAIATQHGGLQRRTLLLANRRQLGTVTNEQQTAVAVVIDETHQIVEQRGIAIGYHRCLVNDEQRIVGTVEVQVETTLQGLLTVDTAMDGVGRTASIEREHFGSSTCRRHQHQFLLQRHHTTDDSSGQCRLARACRPAQHHDGLTVATGHKVGKHA